MFSSVELQSEDSFINRNCLVLHNDSLYFIIIVNVVTLQHWKTVTGIIVKSKKVLNLNSSNTSVVNLTDVMCTR